MTRRLRSERMLVPTGPYPSTVPQNEPANYCRIPTLNYTAYRRRACASLRYTVPGAGPDMAYWSFTESILKGLAIPVYGEGKLLRDFTYVDDIIAALVQIVERPHAANSGQAPHQIYNLGNSHPESVMDLIGYIERQTNLKAQIDFKDGPPGDVRETFCRHLACRPGLRFCTEDFAGGRNSALRRLVPALSSCLGLRQRGEE